MRHASSSRFSYRNVLIAAGLAAGLQVSTAYAEPKSAPAAQPHSGDEIPNGSVDARTGGHRQAERFQSR